MHKRKVYSRRIRPKLIQTIHILVTIDVINSGTANPKPTLSQKFHGTRVMRRPIIPISIDRYPLVFMSIRMNARPTNARADEERVHAGEFLRLLHHLAPDEQKFYDEGYEEVEEEIKKLGK